MDEHKSGIQRQQAVHVLPNIEKKPKEWISTDLNVGKRWKMEKSAGHPKLRLD